MARIALSRWMTGIFLWSNILTQTARQAFTARCGASRRPWSRTACAGRSQDDSWIPLRTPKLADALADHLEQLILEGALRPGEKLAPERELADKLEVSRPSLREALDKLHARGLIETNKAGNFVSRFLTPHDRSADRAAAVERPGADRLSRISLPDRGRSRPARRRRARPTSSARRSRAASKSCAKPTSSATSRRRPTPTPNSTC